MKRFAICDMRCEIFFDLRLSICDLRLVAHLMSHVVNRTSHIEISKIRKAPNNAKRQFFIESVVQVEFADFFFCFIIPENTI